MNADLASWRDGAARSAIVDFVRRVTTDGSDDYVDPVDRVAVADNDGTLWTEKPMQIEIGFILQRLAAMAEQDPDLRAKQPWKAASAEDYAWLGGAITKHYGGDDSDLKVLMGGFVRAFAGMSAEDYLAASGEYLRNGSHPTLGRGFRQCAFGPMVELLRYLEAHGFTLYVASGGDRDFIRAISDEAYGIPSERVIGSSNALAYQEDEHGASVVYQAQPDVFDDGPVKAVRIWSRIGRRPILSVGNANGDIPMLEFTGGPSLPALRLVVLHDDEEREFAYTDGADELLDRASDKGWTVISVRNDWTTVF
ncbi:HAD family hydrolase [Jiangella alkaliphila]|uniref:Haloacid dehalogenase-like hydrolase n=1 Tax=Jiangella alkaliphila TaxID=419479 RepID=A0A1H2LDC8_9ACTN|nr:HAD family hydrolase [Jiangella alkaliphila]SDU78824.1 haloacid dehalogenase-like hydrolase [Jiangella alkaliphila]